MGFKKQKITLRTIFCIAVVSFACADAPGLCDSLGNYPGTGDYSAWQQAADANEDGVDYAKRGNYTMAIQCYDEAIQQYPGDASFYFNKGIALRKRERTKEAVLAFKKATELEPKFASAWYNKGNALEELKDLRGAEECYRQSLKLDPKHGHAWFNLGELLFKQKKLQEAKDAFAQAKEFSNEAKDIKDIADYLAEIERLLKKAEQLQTSG